jgi:hypothetical protein
MKARFVSESIDFQRGQDPKKTMGLGARSILEKRRLGATMPPEKISPQITRMWNHIQEDLGEKLSDIYILGNDRDEIPDYIIEKLSKHIGSPEAQKRTKIVHHGTGPYYHIYETPYGRVLRERVGEGEGYLNSYLVGYQTALNLDLPKHLSSVRESLEFERGKSPKEAMNIGIIAKIENVVNDDDELEDLISEIDMQLGAAMGVYLPEEERKEMGRMWLRNHYKLPPYHEFRVLDREDDGDEEASGPKIDYEVKELEKEGWRVFYDENNFGQVQTILVREKL